MANRLTSPQEDFFLEEGREIDNELKNQIIKQQEEASENIINILARQRKNIMEIYKQNPKIVVLQETKDKLDKLIISKGDTYDNIINRLLLKEEDDGTSGHNKNIK